MNLSRYKLSNIVPSRYQARQEDKQHVVDIAASIAKNDLLQAPLARKIDGGKVEITLGNTRLASYNLLYAYLAGADVDSYSGYVPFFTSEFKRATVDKYAADFEKMPIVVVSGLDDRLAFEQGIAENFDRKNLTTMEAAHAMRQYIDLFGATSAEVGRLFGYISATVRTMIRFTNLPEAAQASLDSGDMSQDSAKKLLSIMRLLPGETDALAAMLSSAMIRNPSDASGVIRSALMGYRPVIMWGTLDTSLVEPYRGGRGLWVQSQEFAIDNSALPINKLKKNLITLRIYDRMLLEIQASGESDDAEWAAQVADDAIRDASEGSAELLETNFGVSQHSAEIIKAIVQPPACKDCPFRIALDKTHYCTNRDCHAQRVKVWSDAELHCIHKETKIPIYAASDGEYETIQRGYDERTFQKWVNSQADHLRLMITKPALQKYPIIESHVIALVSVRDELQPEVIPPLAIEANPAESANADGPEALSAHPAQESGEQTITDGRESIAEERKRIAEERAREKAEQDRRRAIDYDIIEYIHTIAAPYMAQKLAGGSFAFWQNVGLYTMDTQDASGVWDDDQTQDENRADMISSVCYALITFNLSRDYALPENRAEIHEFVNHILQNWTGENDDLPKIPETWKAEDEQEAAIE